MSVLALAHLHAQERAATHPNQPLLNALVEEQQRGLARMRLPGYEAPYFISYLLRSTDHAEVEAKHGAVYSRDREQRRQLYVEVRVGDYRFDNTAPSADSFEAQDSIPEDAYEARADAPIE